MALYIVCFLRLGVVLWCNLVGVWVVVIFVLSVMRVVGGVPFWVECVSSCRCCVFVWWKRTRVWVLLWLCLLL